MSLQNVVRSKLTAAYSYENLTSVFHLSS